MQIKHAVILMAGKGTRFLPATKAVAKELFPIGNKPALLLLLKECVDSGITEVTIVISKQKKDVIKFLKKDKNLDEWLKICDKESQMQLFEQIISSLKINFVYQGKMNGSGGAIMSVKKFIKDQPFIVLLGDDFCLHEANQLPASKQLIETFNKTKKYVLGAKQIDSKDICRYGVIKKGKSVSDTEIEVKGFVEKPSYDKAPSNIATVARYILLPSVFDYILKVKPKANGEVYFTEAIELALENEGVVACIFDAKYYDLGNYLEFIKCQIEMGLRDEEVRSELAKYLKSLNEEI